jgi:predicted RNA-binding Zn-ribbon protein involved in translation (DUF1610 family)
MGRFSGIRWAEATWSTWPGGTYVLVNVPRDVRLRLQEQGFIEMGCPNCGTVLSLEAALGKDYIADDICPECGVHLKSARERARE